MRGDNFTDDTAALQARVDDRLGTLNSSWEDHCVTCGARPGEPCRAVVRRDKAHGQEVKEPHADRRRGRRYWGGAVPRFAEETRLRLWKVWS